MAEWENAVPVIYMSSNDERRNCPTMPWLFKIVYIYRYWSVFQNICL